MNWPRLFKRKPKAVSPSAYFGGAQSNRLTEDWMASILSADQELKGDLRALRGRSRQMYRDDGLFHGLVTSLQNNVIGRRGMPQLQAKVKSTQGNLKVELNDMLEVGFQRWGHRDTCCADGQASWWELQRLVLATLWIDGEVFLRRLPGFGNRFGYALQMIDADLVDERYQRYPTATQNAIRMGVEINEWGRPVAYYIWNAHPSDPFGKRRERVRVPADEIIHVFVQWRTGQRRGIPVATPVMILSHMLDGYTQAEVMQARAAAAGGGGFFEMTADAAEKMGIVNPTGDDIKKPLVMESEPVTARQLPIGWNFKEWNPTHPNQEFAPFQKAITRVMARGVGFSYMTAAGDLSETSYSSGRIGLLDERDNYRVYQGFLEDRLNRPVYEDFVRYASLTGAVKLPTEDVERYFAHAWEWRGYPWVDLKNEIDAAAMELALRIQDRTSLCADRGRDVREVWENLQREEALAAELGITLPLVGVLTPRQLSEEDASDTGPNSPPSSAPAKPKAPPSMEKRAQTVATELDAVLGHGNGTQ